MQLTEVVPWGRSMAEYRSMFSLTEADLANSLLGVGDGPASFNAELTRQRGRVVSIDPIYKFSGEDIRQRVEHTYETVIEQTRANAHRYNWTTFRNADELGQHRMQAMSAFLADYPAGQQQGRYQAQQLPALSFTDQAFDLALVSHLLFLYSDHLSQAFHVASVLELLRVATEVRIFPLLDLAGSPSAYVAAVEEQVRQAGFDSQRVTVPYEFQKGGNQMLRLMRKAPWKAEVIAALIQLGGKEFGPLYDQLANDKISLDIPAMLRETGIQVQPIVDAKATFDAYGSTTPSLVKFAPANP